MPPFSTPFTEHLKRPEYYSVYDPAEDSFLFLDALQRDWTNIERLRPTICLEMGCGSGIVTAFLAQNLAHPAIMICVDINPAAISATQLTFQKNVASSVTGCECVVASLAECFLPASTGQVDLILFNPPYVVTSSKELADGDLTSKAWAGGVDGREVLDKFLPQASRLLSAEGVMYCVIIKPNQPESIAEFMLGRGFKTDCIKERKCRNEHLIILRFSRVFSQ
ncbi:methyltransferase N6AMT1-like [Paramacrobiotus metropolitanus]|uniref:methyltransferase N6AMT1-like n=1 Tax=Paramacrobiotus metropolitanus TaxID=2943436 RepID=UPI002446188E|nr:methyltransferase N6AMT1-like [Paramacrobiotus metropolitanus]